MEDYEFERNWQLLEQGVQKTRLLLAAPELASSFTAADYMTYYTCVYDICAKSRTLQIQVQLRERYKKALEESIQSEVLPMLKNKQDGSLLAGLFEMWERYKVMTRALIRIFCFVDKSQGYVPLDYVATNCFCNLVCTTYFWDMQQAVISLINLGRGGKPIDFNLIRNVLAIFSEIDKLPHEYSKGLVQAIVSDFAIYFKQFASTWLPSETYDDCLLKAAWAFREEELFARQYMNGTTLDNYLQAVQQNMMLLFEIKVMKVQEIEELAKSSIQELLLNVSTMSISGQPSSSQPHLP